MKVIKCIKLITSLQIEKQIKSEKERYGRLPLEESVYK